MVELLQCPQVLANDGCMQVCSKLPCPLQNIGSLSDNDRKHEATHLPLLTVLCRACVKCICTCQHSWDTHMNHEPTVLMSIAWHYVVAASALSVEPKQAANRASSSKVHVT